jgi:hypothetical protein
MAEQNANGRLLSRPRTGPFAAGQGGLSPPKTRGCLKDVAGVRARAFCSYEKSTPFAVQASKPRTAPSIAVG